MQLKHVISLAATSLATLAAADRMEIVSTCGLGGWVCSSSGTFITDFGRYPIDANEGCRNPGTVPALNQMCMDWGNQRMHFYFDNQAKRCMRLTGHNPDYHCSEGCDFTWWDEVQCTW